MVVARGFAGAFELAERCALPSGVRCRARKAAQAPIEGRPNCVWPVVSINITGLA